MKVVTLVTCAALCALPLLAASPVQPQLVFEPAGDGSGFVARTREGSVMIRPDRATFAPRGGRTVSMRIERSASTSVEALDRQPGISNYFLGNDPARWRTSVPHYARVRYRDIYPGIDLVYYGNEHQLEYDFIVGPGADPRVIQLAFDGADRITTDKAGDLLINAGGHVMRQLRPRVYQQDGDRRREVHGAYRIRTGGAVEFALSRFDRTRPLVIDPVIQYSTYIGRGGQDTGVGVAVDAAGNAFIAGETTSAELATNGALQGIRAGDQDAFIAKVSPQGIILFITYLGGSKTDTGLGVAVDEGGNPYVCGITASANFPARSGRSSEPAGGDFDSFVVKLNPTGTQLVYGTYLGGRNLEWASAIAVDALGGAWVTGWTTSHDFPVQGPYQSSSAGGGEEVFLTRLSPSGLTITYSTFFGGNGRDLSTGIAVDATNAVYVAGATTSTAFPLSNAAQPRSAGDQDAFVFKLIPEKNDLVYSTFLGGSSEDLAARLAIDPSGNAFIVGYTKSANFPVSRGAFQAAPSGATDMFAAKLSPAGAIEYATRLGGSGDDWPGGAAADAAGTLYVSGWTNSANFPVRNAPQSAYSGGENSTQRFDSVVLRLSPAGDELLYSTFFGGRGEDKAYGLALDRAGNVFIAGSTTSANLPNPQGEFVTSGPGVTDVFVARLSADTAVTALAARPAALTFSARSGDSTTSQQQIAITSTGAPLTFSTASSAPWLTVRPESGSTPFNVTASVDATALPPGSYTGEITVRSLASTLRIGVTLNVSATAPNIVSVSPSPVPRADHDVTIAITGGGFTPASQVEINGARVATTFVDSRNLRAVVPGSLAYQQGALTIAVVNAEARSNTVSLQVVAVGPAVGAGGVVHGATRLAGPVAPGQITIVSGAGFGGDALISSTATDGRLPSALSGTRVLFDGVPAPVIWAQPGQIAVVAPYAIAGKATVQAVVEHNGAQAAPYALAVAPSAPGLFTADTSGSGQAAALNENGSFNSPSLPAAKGSILVLYGTGEGQVSPAVADGLIVPAAGMPHPVLPPAVTIGGVAAEVVYAGSVPGSVVGLLQMNVRIPASVSSGPAVPVAITVGTATSPAGVTVAIE